MDLFGLKTIYDIEDSSSNSRSVDIVDKSILWRYLDFSPRDKPLGGVVDKSFIYPQYPQL